MKIIHEKNKIKEKKSKGNNLEIKSTKKYKTIIKKKIIFLIKILIIIILSL